MAITLEEFKRTSQEITPTLAGVVTVFQENAPILGEGRNLGYPLPALAFENTKGGVASFTREKKLPNVGFRGINQPFTASEGETEQKSERLAIAGGKVVYDRALVARSGEAALVNQQIMQISAMARRWNECFYTGDGLDDTFTGLNARISGKQLVTNAGTGGALDLKQLDESLLQLSGDNRVIVMGRGMAARLFQCAKMSANVGYTPQTYGVCPATYSGVPIMLAGDKADESDILGFTEEEDTTSIYILSLGASGVVGVQTAPIGVHFIDAGNKTDSSFEVEWDASFIVKSPRAAIRIKGIADKAITPAAVFYGAVTP